MDWDRYRETRCEFPYWSYDEPRVWHFSSDDAKLHAMGNKAFSGYNQWLEPDCQASERFKPVAILNGQSVMRLLAFCSMR